MSSSVSPRVVVEPRAGGVSIEIRPLARTPALRRRLILAGAVVLAAAFVGGARLAGAWESGLRRGAFEDLPLRFLIPITIAVGVSTPFALLGLAALAFAEERIEVTPEAVSIQSTAFERTRRRVIRRADLTAWVETYRPISPWWTWALRRLAARVGSELVPLAGAAGQSEKRAIGIWLARATGRPLLAPSGEVVDAGGTVRIPG